MAIINNNVQNVKFLRNQTPFESRELARQALENNKSQAADGTALLARYTITDGQTTDVKTLVGFVAEVNSTKYVTIFDVEGASADVEALRQEINAKLGTGITSSNTATKQLAALSGNGQSTSAETSVEGAKRYADELKNQMDYSGVTTGTGVYVTNVTESDGIVSATTATLPTVTGEVESKKVVMSVSEDKGTISVAKGTIESSDNTVVIDDLAEGNGIDFKVNIDNDTLIADDSTGVISVASAALTQYVGDGKTIEISAADEHNNKTVSSLLTIEEVTTSVPDTVAHRYQLAGSDSVKIGQYIDIPKDSALVNFYLGHVDDLLQGTQSQSEEGDTATVVPGSGDAALVWIMLLNNGKYKLTAVNVESFIDEAEFASGVTWDATARKVKGVVDGDSEAFLTVGAGGFKLAGVQAAIDAKVNALDVTGDTAQSGKYITHINEEDGLISIGGRDDISKAPLNDYSKGSDATAVAASDTINQAISKLENQIDTAKSAATTVVAEGTDAGNNMSIAETAGADGHKIFTINLSDVASAQGLADEIAARKAVDGQTGQTYEANSSANYISNANDLNDADVKLDAALKTADDAMLTGVTAGNGISVSTKSGKSQTISAKVKNGGGIVNDADGLHLDYIDAGVYDVE